MYEKKTSNKMKQILALVLSAVMVVGTVNASGMTTYAEEGSVTEETHSNHGNCGVIGCTDEIHSGNENHSADVTEWTALDQEKLNGYMNTKFEKYNLPDGNYYLTEDLTLNYWIAISGNVNLCLNGKSISGNAIVVYEDATLNLCDCKKNGKITKANGDAGVECRGTFNMYGGNITDNENIFYGGGVYVCNGTFNMYGGSITNNKVTDGSVGQGGGVCLDSSSNFTMYGGKIADNSSAKYGGGVYVLSSTFTMSGGSITGNEAPTGAGVYMDNYRNDYLNLSGTPVIEGNISGGNLYKYTDASSGGSVTITITDELKEGASIGVTWKDNNSDSQTGDFVVAGANYTLTDSDKAKFHSDDSSYAIGLRNNTLALGTSIESATVALNQENYVYDGAPCEPNVTVSLGEKTLNKDTDYTVSYSNNQNAGTATVTINGAGDYVGTITKNFTISKSGSSFGDTLKAYNSEEQESSEFTYGDRITIKAKPQLTGETTENVVTAEDSSSETIPTSGKMALYAGDTQISEIVDAANAVDGVYTMTCDTAEKNLSIGNNIITAKYWDDVNVKDCSQNITVNLKEKELSITKVTAENRKYDSSNIVDITEIKLEGIIASDDVSVSMNGIKGTLSSANVGEYTSVTLPELTLTGADVAKYTLKQPVDSVSTNVVISKIDNAPNMPEREINVSYNHKTVSDVTTLPQGWTWKDSDKTVELKVGEVVKATAVYTEEDKVNYETVEVIVSITRSACKHELSKKDKVEATSEKAGQKEYWFCSLCEKKFADAEGKTEITNEKDLVIPALENTDDQNKTSDAPAAGTVLTDTKTKATYKIVTSDTQKGTVAYVQPTSKKEKTVTIPATVTLDGITYRVTKVADDAFKNNKYITKITIGNNITEIGKSAFQGCNKLKTVNLGKNVTTIDNKAFYKCTALTKITIPSKVKTIGKSAFEGCKKLKTVTIGKSVAKIGAKAFYGCSKVKTLTIKSTKLTTKKIGSKAFGKTPKSMTVKIPKKKFKAYKSMLIKRGVNKKAKFKKI